MQEFRFILTNSACCELASIKVKCHEDDVSDLLKAWLDEMIINPGDTIRVIEA